MRVLLTGGAGYIGSHTAAELLAAGVAVVVADSLETGFRAAVPAGAEFHQGDLRDPVFCGRLFSGSRIDGVIHFAASSQVGESMMDPLKYYRNNLGGARTLLEAMVAHGVDKLVFSSSAAVYGEPECVPIPETAPTLPTNCYGDTKLAIERMLKWVGAAHGVRYVALRYFNACGARPDGTLGEAHRPETHLIPLILQVPNGQRSRISVFGDDYPTPDGTCIRDYVHVCDLAQAHLLALRYLDGGGRSETLNLGSGTGFSVSEVLASARRVTGHPIPAVVCPRRAGDPARLVASGERARQVLGWEPRYDRLDQIVATAWNWHRTHPNGFGDPR